MRAGKGKINSTREPLQSLLVEVGMPAQHRIHGIVHGKALETLESCLDEMELALVTVRDIIDRNAAGASFEESYIGVNLGLYVAHTEATITQCRELLTQRSRPKRDH